MPPKAFISHASEDKDRFVLKFAEALRSRGVDAWLDKWEMTPGDSLVQRIFEEGIKNADVFIVILSNYSVAKPWVREELDAGFVKKINKTSKLIPILLDDCEVPECLKATVWETVKSLSDIDSHAIRIANIIHGINEKPPLGPPPTHVTTVLDIYPGLVKQDAIVLQSLCELSLHGDQRRIDFSVLKQKLKDISITPEEISDSIQVLSNRYLISGLQAVGGNWVDIKPNSSVVDDYLKATASDYPQVLQRICIEILNKPKSTNQSIAEETGNPLPIINHILDMLSSQRLITTIKLIDRTILITGCSVEFRRMLQNNSTTK